MKNLKLNKEEIENNLKEKDDEINSKQILLFEKEKQNVAIIKE